MGKENGKGDAAEKEPQRSGSAASRVVVSFHGKAARAWRDKRSLYPGLSDSDILLREQRGTPFEAVLSQYEMFRDVAAKSGTLPQNTNSLLSIFEIVLRLVHQQGRDPRSFEAAIKEAIAKGGVQNGQK